MKTFFLRGFPTCCADLEKALKHPDSSVFFMNQEGVLCMNVGKSEDHSAHPPKTTFYDMQLGFCPFCGKELAVMK